MVFRQLFDDASSTYTYLIADRQTQEAVLIDPVATNISDYVALLSQLGGRLKYSIETHVHADHVSAGGLLRQRLGAETAVSQRCGAVCADHQLRDGDILRFGRPRKSRSSPRRGIRRAAYPTYGVSACSRATAS